VDPLARVCLALSSFKNDQQVLALLQGARADLPRFARVLVVDSLGTGQMPARLAEAGLADLVQYECASANLGSAGNLARRLSLAAQTSADFVYTTNHDGDVSPSAIERLVTLAQNALGPVGAIYPLRKMSDRGGAFDMTGRFRFPMTAVRSMRPPSAELSPVFWSSSNGALYALAPTRQGLLPMAELWMGYEDLGYGWLLHGHGFRQFLARDVQVVDGYEYKKTPVGYVTNKPSWYAYYFARNLLLAARRTQQPGAVRLAALSRVLLEFGITAALRSDKKARLSAVAAGLFDGLRDRGGKWRLP
jgi:GT2 family glycosyltransferase